LKKSQTKNPLPKPSALNRREFFTRVGGTMAVAGVVGLPSPSGNQSVAAATPKILGGDAPPRNVQAYQLRVNAARDQFQQKPPPHPDNGDELLYSKRIGNYSKGLPHNDLGEVDPAAYNELLRAVYTGDPAAFEAIPMGCPPPHRNLTNPQAGLAFELEGGDAASFSMPPAPAFASAWRAGEIVENYWMALLRDVPFSQYGTDPLAQVAAAELSALSDFRGPRVNGAVTADTLFRNITPGDTVGPWVSQFFLRPCPFGANYVEQRVRTTLPTVDHMTEYPDWLNIQRGCQPAEIQQYDPVRRYIRTGRDMAQWVHIDVLYQAYFHALLILLTPPSIDPLSGGIGAPFDAANPYLASANQDGFTTFGAPHVATLLTEVAARVLKAQWFQKWYVHRALRPEAFAGRVHNHITGAANYPLHGDVLNSAAVQTVFLKHGTYLLPQVFVEGSPLHPSYGSGHATVAGACVTILKAWFDESYVIPNPVEPTPDGLSLQPYSGPPLTVGGELNKIASNVAFGRNFAGIHWRSDAIEAMKLGENAAIRILRDQRLCYNERFDGFTFTSFDGATVRI
jgi:membrane-associated phospholipid phosphatase